ncbi:hypothetical protein NMY22_g14332 [Coprinellus aureogranulatus]|nr:hypothetical protein NMY22_g14332 [Coprinellus aureogranulatus]
MGFFENSHNFSIGQSYNSQAAGSVTFNIDNRGAQKLLPPNLQASAYIPTRVNRIGASSAPQLHKSADILSSPPIAMSKSMPTVPRAKGEATARPRSSETSSANSQSKDEPTVNPPSFPLSSPSPPSKSPAYDPSEAKPILSGKDARMHSTPSSPSSAKVFDTRPEQSPVQTETLLAETEVNADGTAPKFRHGIVAAVAAQTHLLKKTNAIRNLLQKHGILHESSVAVALN